MFERFTGAARAAVMESMVTAERLGDNEIDDGHLLLVLAGSTGVAGTVLTGLGLTEADVEGALVRRHGGDGPFDAAVADALRTIGIDLDEIRRAAEENFGPGALDRPPHPDRRRWGRPRFGKPGKKTLEYSLKEAIRRGHHYIGTEHLLLGMVRLSGGVGAEVLREFDVTPDLVRARVTDALRRAS